ncbi:MAG: hypothetical protein EOM51_06220 [Clostridia bacterium]|nr:hypothetical protein [Clostridia bacterium]
MSKARECVYYPLAIQEPELIEIFLKKTKTAILVLSISYLVGLVLFVPLSIFKPECCFYAFFAPLIGYCWLITFGAKKVNNRFGIKKISGDIMLYQKRNYSYTTYAALLAVVFLVSSLIRLAYEVKNYTLIKQVILEREYVNK